MIKSFNSSPVTPTSRKVRRWRRCAVCGLFLFLLFALDFADFLTQDTIRTLPDTVLGNECGREAFSRPFFCCPCSSCDKMHFAIHGHTAAELIYERADAEKPHMGLTTWADAPDGKILKSDVRVAKNYLSESEMRSLERIVSAYLDLAEDRAERHIPMTMEDWSKRLDLFLMADDREVLHNAGRITAEIAKSKAGSEFEKYRVIQDRLFMSDFDKYLEELENAADNND